MDTDDLAPIDPETGQIIYVTATEANRLVLDALHHHPHTTDELHRLKEHLATMKMHAILVDLWMQGAVQMHVNEDGEVTYRQTSLET